MVALGDLAYQEFVFTQITVGSRESADFWKRLTQAFPHNIYVTGPEIDVDVDYTRQRIPFTFRVWDSPERIPDWDRFVKEHDVPDYCERFKLKRARGSPDAAVDEFQSCKPRPDAEPPISANALD